LTGVASTHRHLTQTVDRSAPVSLPTLRDSDAEVWDVRKKQIGCYDDVRATKQFDGRARKFASSVYS